jgi:hypothetical protein
MADNGFEFSRQEVDSILNREDKTKLNDLITMARVSYEHKKLEDKAGEHLDIYKVKGDLKKRLLEKAEVAGQELSEEAAEAGVEHYYQGLYCFEKPERNFGYKLARLYVDRKKIFWRRIVPAIGIGIFGLGIFGAFKTFQYAHKKGLEKEVEIKVEKAYQDKEMLDKKIRSISDSQFKEGLPEIEKIKLEEVINNSHKRLNETDGFFDRFCSDGTAGDDISQDNYKQAESQLVGVRNSLEFAEKDIIDGQGIIQTQKQVGTLRKSLDNLIGEIKNLQPSDIFLQRAETTYQNGIVCLENRQVNKAQERREELENIRGNIMIFSDLTRKTQEVYDNIKDIAKQDKAITQGEKLYGQAERFIESADVSGLKPVVEQLENLDALLNQEYTIKIVNRPGVKTGIDRYYEGRFSGWYLIVEAIGSDGKAVPVDITSCETGRTERVRIWGEKVIGDDPEIVRKIRSGRYNRNSLLNKVIADKLDNGIVEDNIAGEKERGYLDYELNNKEFLGKQITEW